VTTRLGEGEFVYEVAHDWGELPDGWTLGDVAAVAVDRTDRVYVFHRGTHPLIVFDRDGRFLCSWGDDVFNQPHGLHIGDDDMIYCTDTGPGVQPPIRVDAYPKAFYHEGVLAF